MSLVFIGDIASPNAECSQALKESLEQAGDLFEGNDVVLNFEGMVADLDLDTGTPVLFNHPSVLQVLQDVGTRAVSLANNHTLDLPEALQETSESLSSHNIGYCGAGVTVADSERATRFQSGGVEVLVFGFCWDVLMQHQSNQDGVCYVNPINPRRALEIVRRARAENPEAKIVLKMHWSFDLETRPFPMYRELSKRLIDAGADAIIGCHSHCVQGGERYKDGIIIYGLGNFYIPWHTFIGGTIHFPEFARTEMALEWDPVSGAAKCHWFRYENQNDQHQLVYEGACDFDTDERLKEYTPYAGMDAGTYLPWFTKNRRKRKFIPVHRDDREVLRNRMIDLYLIARIRFARLLARTGLREWNN